MHVEKIHLKHYASRKISRLLKEKKQQLKHIYSYFYIIIF